MRTKRYLEHNGLEFEYPYASCNNPDRTEVLPNGNILAGWIEQDEDPINPRVDFDNLGTMVCMHRRYDLGDKHNYKSSDFSGWDELGAQIIKDEGPCIMLDCYLYDHGGITMNTTGFSCPWDSGRVGIIYVSHAKLRKECGWKHITKARRDNVTKWLRDEVETYDDYLTGNVYGVITQQYLPDGTKLGGDDACWGYFGRRYAEEELDAHFKNSITETT